MSKHRAKQPQESELDFDLRNYTLDDLYKLFKLVPDSPLNADTLRQAKRILVFTHPDKSGLPPHYFQFFSKAYGMLAEMEGITNNIKKRERGNAYVDDINTYSNEIHNTIKETNFNTNSVNKRTEIMKEFNTRFEEINRDMLPESDGRGYADWLKHENPEENVQNHKELYNRRKQELREQYALSTNKIQPPSFYSSSGSSLLDNSNDFTSGLFDTIQYTDLKKSYTETIIPVSEDDYHQMPSYRNVDEYKRAREFNSRDPSIYRDHKSILENNEEEDRKMSNYRAYELTRQLEASEQKNRMFASQFYKILN
jgi:hypothetical protein